jgi:hypothetical protein
MLKIDEGDFGLAATLRIKLVLEEFGHERFGELDSCRLSRSCALLGLCVASRTCWVLYRAKSETNLMSSLDGRGYLQEKMDTSELARGFETT